MRSATHPLQENQVMKDWMKFACVLLAGAATALAQSILEEGLSPDDYLPGKLEVILKESSLAQLDRDGIVKGSLITGLASLDSLNRQLGLLAIEAPQLDPRDTLIGPQLIYVLEFSPEADVGQLVELYRQCEHLDHVSPVLIYRTSVRPSSWGELKKALQSPVR